MPDPTPANPPAPDPTPNAGTQTSPHDTRFTQEDVNRIVQQRVARITEQYGGDPETVRARVERAAELERQQMTELQQAQADRDEARRVATTSEQAALRLQVALERGFTGDRAWLATRLQGQDLEQLRADADQMLSLMTPTAPPAPTTPPAPAEAPAPANPSPAPTPVPNPAPVAPAPPQDGGASPLPTVNDDEAVQTYMKQNFPYLFPAAHPASVNGGQ
jgi:hypothetical protein